MTQTAYGLRRSFSLFVGLEESQCDRARQSRLTLPCVGLTLPGEPIHP